MSIQSSTRDQLEVLDARQVAKRYRACAVASVYDVLDELGYPNQCLDLGIKPLVPEWRLAGPAFTVVGSREPRWGEEHAKPALKDHGLLRSIPPGSVVVINAERDTLVGHWGEIMSITAKTRGAVGAVIDGGTRDRNGIVKIPDWAVFARYTSPVECRQRWQPQEMQVPIYMSGTLTSSVLVRPGDYLVGDADGVVVVPDQVVIRVLELTEELEVREENTRRDVVAGVPIEEVYNRYGRL